MQGVDDLVKSCRASNMMSRALGKEMNRAFMVICSIFLLSVWTPQARAANTSIGYDYDLLGEAVAALTMHQFERSEKLFLKLCEQTRLCIKWGTSQELKDSLEQSYVSWEQECKHENSIACLLVATRFFHVKDYKRMAYYLFESCRYSNEKVCYILAEQLCEQRALESAFKAFELSIHRGFSLWDSPVDKIKCLKKHKQYAELEGIYHSQKKQFDVSTLPSSVFKDVLTFVASVQGTDVKKMNSLTKDFCAPMGEKCCFSTLGEQGEGRYSEIKNSDLFRGLIDIVDNKLAQGVGMLVKSCRAENMFSCYLLASFYSIAHLAPQAQLYLKTIIIYQFFTRKEWDRFVEQDKAMTFLRKLPEYEILKKDFERRAQMKGATR